MKRALISLTLLMAVASAIATEATVTAAPTLDQLIHGVPVGAAAAGISEIRFNAVVETARTRGNSAGLAWESANIARRLNSLGSHLDVIYNFSALMMEGNVLPPVMSKASDVFVQVSDSMISLVGENYVVLQEARLTYVAPSWRSYLSFGEYTFDLTSSPVMTPKGDAELAVWNKALAEGYAMGVDQADQILEMGLSRLKADFEGMRLYRELLKLGMVTKPFVSAGHYGVTGDKSKTLNIGETLLKISATPEFVMTPDKWSKKLDGQVGELLKAAANGGKVDIPVDPIAEPKSSMKGDRSQ